MRRTRLAAFAAAVAATAVAFLPSAAQAYDKYPCGNTWNYGRHVVQTCPLWRGDVPVFATASRYSRVVGMLRSRWGQWFTLGVTGGTYSLGAAGVNHWWAQTMADNGAWGYVPQVFFSGGGNYEPDGRLRRY